MHVCCHVLAIQDEGGSFIEISLLHISNDRVFNQTVPDITTALFLLHEAEAYIKHVNNNTTTLCLDLFSMYALSNLKYVNPKRHPLLFNHL
jgi:hypothetical protein